MSDAEVADSISVFAKAAADAERLGFDGIEVHAGHGYLINQFFLPELNLVFDENGYTLNAASLRWGRYSTD